MRGVSQYGQVFVNKSLIERFSATKYWRTPCIRQAHECVSHDELRRAASEGEGACSHLFAIRTHLPLRGKLGWMTPRVGVKTTLTTKRTLRGPRSQAGAPFLCPSISTPRMLIPYPSLIPGIHLPHSFPTLLLNQAKPQRSPFHDHSDPKLFESALHPIPRFGQQGKRGLAHGPLISTVPFL
jgi:hypothetical protein